MKIKLTKQDVQKILDTYPEEYVNDDFEKHHRHNGGHQDIIFKKDNKHYLFTYHWEDEYTAVEVVEAEKVIKYWKVVE